MPRSYRLLLPLLLAIPALVQGWILSAPLVPKRTATRLSTAPPIARARMGAASAARVEEWLSCGAVVREEAAAAAAAAASALIPGYQAATDFAAERGCNVELVPAAVAEAAREGDGDEVVVKTLVWEADSTPLVLVLPVLLRVDEEKLRAAAAAVLGTARPSDVRLAPPAVAQELTGFKIGAIPPFGHPAPLPTILDASLQARAALLCGTGCPDTQMRLPPRALLDVACAVPLDIAAPPLPPGAPPLPRPASPRVPAAAAAAADPPGALASPAMGPASPRAEGEAGQPPPAPSELPLVPEDGADSAAPPRVEGLRCCVVAPPPRPPGQSGHVSSIPPY